MGVVPPPWGPMGAPWGPEVAWGAAASRALGATADVVLLCGNTVVIPYSNMVLPYSIWYYHIEYGYMVMVFVWYWALSWKNVVW